LWQKYLEHRSNLVSSPQIIVTSGLAFSKATIFRTVGFSQVAPGVPNCPRRAREALVTHVVALQNNGQGLPCYPGCRQTQAEIRQILAEAQKPYQRSQLQEHRLP
jgi:hypothetical protein